LVAIEVLGGYLLAILTILRIVLQRREPTATLAWVLFIVLLPYVGVLLYLLVGRRRLNRQIRRRHARHSELHPHLDQQEQELAHLEVPEAPPELPKPSERELVLLSNRMGSRPPTCGNKVELLVKAKETYRQLEAAIEGATDHVNMLYYIFEDDRTGKRFRDLLVKKAKEGVVVRLLTDGVGSYGLDSFMGPLRAAGGQHAEFLPVGGLRRHWNLNLRNHRKVAVIDGRLAFTGGVNIADDYAPRRRKKIPPWRDTHLAIRGPAVQHLQEVFAEDWFFATGRDMISERWYPEQQPVGEDVVQIIASGPDTATEPIQRIFFTAITMAKERVFLTTPYFIPDQAMCVALETAALRGVDVRLLLPRHSDHPMVLYAGRSYYDNLLHSGVKIYEYGAAFLHAKSLVVDRTWGTVGSANMDVRSFRLNFEVNAAIYSGQFADRLAEVFIHDLAGAELVTTTHRRQRRMPKRVAESVSRLLSPVL